MIDLLENISENNSVHGSDVNSLLKPMKTFEFLFCIHFLREIMTITNILSKYLQNPCIDCSSIHSMTKVTIQELSNMRCEDTFEGHLYQTLNRHPPTSDLKSAIL